MEIIYYGAPQQHTVTTKTLELPLPRMVGINCRFSQMAHEAPGGSDDILAIEAVNVQPFVNHDFPSLE